MPSCRRWQLPCQPKDAPESFAVSGKYTGPDWRRVDAVGTIPGTSYISPAIGAPPDRRFDAVQGPADAGFLRHQGDAGRHLLGDDRQRFRRQEGQRRCAAHVPPHQARLEGRNGPAPAHRVPARSRSQNSVPDRQRRHAEALSDGRRPRHRIDAIRRRLGLVRGRIRALPAAHRPRRKGPGLLRDQTRRQAVALARPLCGEYAGGAWCLHHAGASLARLRGHGVIQGRQVPLPAARRAALDRSGEEVGDRQGRARISAHSRIRCRQGATGPAGPGSTGSKRTATISATST